MSELVEPRLITVNVKIIGPCPPWSTFQIQILENDSIQKLKTLITCKLSHPESQLALCHSGKILKNDEESLENLKIKENDTLFLVLKSPNKTEESQSESQINDDENQNQDDLDDLDGTISDESINDENDQLSHREKIKIVNQVTHDLFSKNLAQDLEFTFLLLNSHPEAHSILQENHQLSDLLLQYPKIFAETPAKLEEMSLDEDSIKCIHSITEIFERNPLGFGSGENELKIQVEIRQILQQISDSKFLLNPWTFDSSDIMTPGIRARIGKLILICPVFQNMINSPDFVDIMRQNHPNTFDYDIFKQNVEKVLENPDEVLKKLENMMSSEAKIEVSDEESDVSDEESDYDDEIEDLANRKRLISISHYQRHLDFTSDEEEDYKVISNIEDYSGVRVNLSNSSKSFDVYEDYSDEEINESEGEESPTEDPENEKIREESDQNQASGDTSSNTSKDTGLLILIDENLEESHNSNSESQVNLSNASKSNSAMVIYEDSSLNSDEEINEGEGNPTEEPERIEKIREESDQNQGAGDSSSNTSKDTGLLILIDENLEESHNSEGDAAGDNDENCTGIGEKRKFAGDHDGNPLKVLKSAEEDSTEIQSEDEDENINEVENDSDGNQTTDVEEESDIDENDENGEMQEPPEKKVKIEEIGEITEVKTEELYSTQLAQLEIFGFPDRDANIEVIVFTRGNINAAYEILIALGKRGSQIRTGEDQGVSVSSEQQSN